MQRVYAVVVAAALGILATTGSPVGAADGRNGRQVRQAKKVLKALTLVDGAGSGLDADSVQGLTPPMVKDANGALVGGLVSLTDDGDGAGWVIRRIGDRPFLFHVTSAGFSGFPGQLSFESGDCTGQPLLRHRRFGLFPDYAAVSSQTVYYASGSPADHVTASILRFGDSQANCTLGGGAVVQPDGCCITLPSQLTDNFSVAESMPLSELGLVPPFRLDVLPSVGSTTTTTLP
jgi:hypothetical protein